MNTHHQTHLCFQFKPSNRKKREDPSTKDMYSQNNHEDRDSPTGKHSLTEPREESHSNEKSWPDDEAKNSEGNTTSTGIGDTRTASSSIVFNPSSSSSTSGRESSGSSDEAPLDDVRVGDEEMELESYRAETNQQLRANTATLGSPGRGQTNVPEEVSRNKRAQTTRSKTSSNSSDNNEVIVSQPFDVLLGRGKTHRRQPGNIRMHQIVNNYRDVYLNTTTRREKAVLTGKIVKFIKRQSGDKNGRFLRHDPLKGGWVEVSDEHARHKVGHALRDKPRYTWMEGINIESSTSGEDEVQSSLTAVILTERSPVLTGQKDKDIKLGVTGIKNSRRQDKEASKLDEKEETNEEQRESTSDYIETSDWLPRGWFDGPPRRSSFGPGRSSSPNDE